jgi:hypothetical protein
LGTFSIYWHEPRSPTEQDHKLVEQMTHLAAVVIERKRNEAALTSAFEEIAKSEAELRTIIDAIPQLIVACGVVHGRSGRRSLHIAHVPNHRSVTHSTVTAIYDRYRYDKEKRAALEKWAEVLFGIVDVKPAPTTAPARRTQRQNVYEFKPQVTRRAQASVH